VRWDHSWRGELFLQQRLCSEGGPLPEAHDFLAVCFCGIGLCLDCWVVIGGSWYLRYITSTATPEPIVKWLARASHSMRWIRYSYDASGIDMKLGGEVMGLGLAW
jgi:hypothetical protein